ncbi:Glutathione S-transferase T1 [Dichanthelium oligosanthes]|uniref:Glutathione S-transferase T1 n=1 Tax=Dichanthelium oligosanthes TaxID=888268 RepID=A0A1E5V451_9POAL|nr:Glutathione S-transferase T1 [Dichanthelium oligosanthes]
MSLPLTVSAARDAAEVLLVFYPERKTRSRAATEQSSLDSASPRDGAGQEPEKLPEPSRSSAMRPIKVYADRRSQPSRAVIIFCRVNRIDFEEVAVDLFKAQHLTPEFKKVNPMGQVPAIVDGRFKLFESHAILRYLASVFPGVADHWYPADLFARAKIDSILDWHHSNLRRGAATFVMHTALAPFLGLTPRPDAAKQAEKLLVQSLATIETVWLKGEAKFLLGSPQPSIADLSLVCEIMQLEVPAFLILVHVLGDDARDRFLGGHEKILTWISNVKKATSPHFEEAHMFLFEVKGQMQSKAEAVFGSEPSSKLKIASRL